MAATSTRARPAAPPTTPPAIVPAGAVSELPPPPPPAAELVVLAADDVAVPSAPAAPTPAGYGDVVEPADGVVVEYTVDCTVD